MKIAAGLACVALLSGQTASDDKKNLQGCPANRSEVGWLLMNQKELGRAPGGTTSYSPAGIRFFGDPVLGIYQDSSNTAWLHIRLSRPGATYFAAMKKRYAPVAERDSCGAGYDGCYMKLKDDGKIYSMHSFDFSTFSGRMEKEGEPDGPYLICFYN
jgi:hypothetical protein